MRMVNTGFPQRVRYGFEMVDARKRILSIAGSRHQSKIYAESNQSDYSQIFRDFTSMQTLAIYRRLLVKEQLRDQPQRNKNRRLGLGDVLSAAHGLLARAGARAITERQAPRLGEAAAGRSIRGRVRRHRGGVGHD